MSDWTTFLRKLADESPPAQAFGLRETAAELERLAGEVGRLSAERALTTDDKRPDWTKADAHAPQAAMVGFLDRRQKQTSCPCEILPVSCSENCTCANQFKSGGCSRCCKYGSEEQKLAAANRLVGTERLVVAIIEALSVMKYAGPVQFGSPAAERLIRALHKTGMSDFEINMAARDYMESQR